MVDPPSFWFAFTDWALVAGWLQYSLLTYVHVLNNDLGRETYIEVDPSTVDDTKRPYNWWRITTAVYEFNMSANVVVVFLFFIVEWPFMVITGEVKVYPWYA